MHHTQDPYRVLQRLAGTWSGAEVVRPPLVPAECAADGELIAAVRLGGRFVVTDYRQSRQGAADFEGHGVYGYDPDRGLYTMHWFDAASPVSGPVAEGRWSGETLSFERTGALGAARYSYRWPVPDRLHFELALAAADGGWAVALRGDYRRRARA